MLPVILAMAMLATVFGPKPKKDNDRDGFAEDENGFFEMGMLWSLVGAVVIAIVILLTLNLLAPQTFTAVADLTHTLSTAQLNSTLANGICSVIAQILPVAFVLAFVAVPFGAFELFRRVKVGGGKRSGY